jgi:intracellular sulfur oxidation DsrE/DsrF family protein
MVDAVNSRHSTAEFRCTGLDVTGEFRFLAADTGIGDGADDSKARSSKMDRRSIFGPLAAAFVAAPAFGRRALAAGEKKHRLAIHVDQSDIAQMNLALGNASNVLEHYKSRGEEVDIEIVAYAQGLHMLREDTSPVKERIKALREKMPNVVFSACDNTKRRMEKDEGRKITFVTETTVVPSGVVRLMELQEQGWSYVRP